MSKIGDSTTKNKASDTLNAFFIQNKTFSHVPAKKKPKIMHARVQEEHQDDRQLETFGKNRNPWRAT